MNKTARIRLLLAVSVSVAGCGTAKTIVLEPVRTTDRSARAKLVANNPTVEVPPEVTDMLESVIGKGPYESGWLTRGPDVRIVYTFLSHREFGCRAGIR